MRATRYRAFLAQLARLMIRVARRAEDGINPMLVERAAPESVFGRKRMAHMVDLRMPAPAGPFLEEGTSRLRHIPMGLGPCGPTRWSRHPTFLLSLRRFWEAVQWVERPCGTMGTPWLEMWIGDEVEHGL